MRAWVALLLCGCQVYDFWQTEPLAVTVQHDHRVVISVNAKPDLMLVVDRSCSMADAADATRPGCAACANSPCTAASGCASRWSELISAMDTFLAETFPITLNGGPISSPSCGLRVPCFCWTGS